MEQTSLELEAPLEHVTVLQRSALFRRKGKAFLKAGLNELIIKKITYNLDIKSIHVKGKGPGKIINVTAEKKYKTELSNEKKRDLIKKREDLVKQQKHINNNIQNLKFIQGNSGDMLKSLAEHGIKGFSYGKIDLDGVNSLNEMIVNKIREITDKIEEEEEKLQEINKEIAKIDNEISNIDRYIWADEFAHYEIHIVIDAKEDAEFIVELIYSVGQVSWEPNYNIEIGDGVVELSLIANIYNNTGVEWKDVQLTISTGTSRPVKIRIPEPYKIEDYVAPPVVASAMPTPAPPPSPKRLLSKKSRAMGIVDDASLYEAEKPAPVEQAKPDLEMEYAKSEHSIAGIQTYSLSGRYTIPFGSEPKPIPLFSQKLKSTRKYFWSSEMPENALCYESVKNGENVLLPGDAKIFADGEFIGATRIDKIAPNEEFKIGERISYDIKVEKKLIEKGKEKEGAFKGKRSISYKYKIIIQNLKNVKESLILYDVIPYSVSERIKVKLGQFSVNPTSNEMNVLKFEIDLGKIKDKMEIVYDFEVIYEKDVDIYPPLP